MDCRNKECTDNWSILMTTLVMRGRISLSQRMSLWSLISIIIVHHSIYCHFATRYEWKKLYLFFKDEIICLLQVIKFSNFFGKFSNYCEFLRKKWRKSISNTKYIQNIQIFHHIYIIVLNIYSINQSYHVTLKLENQQTMDIGLKFI